MVVRIGDTADNYRIMLYLLYSYPVGYRIVRFEIALGSGYHIYIFIYIGILHHIWYQRHLGKEVQAVTKNFVIIAKQYIVIIAKQYICTNNKGSCTVSGFLSSLSAVCEETRGNKIQ